MVTAAEVRAEAKAWVQVIILALILFALTQCVGYVQAIALGISRAITPPLTASGSVTVESNGYSMNIVLTANQQESETGNEATQRLLIAADHIRKASQ